MLESTVPAATDGSTFTTSVKTALPTPKLALEQETVPLAPTAGVVHDQPPGVETTRRSCRPAAYPKLALAALLGPLFVIVIV